MSTAHDILSKTSLSSWQNTEEMEKVMLSHHITMKQNNLGAIENKVEISFRICFMI